MPSSDEYEAIRHIYRGRMLMYFPKKEGPSRKDRSQIGDMANNLTGAHRCGRLGHPEDFDPRTFAWESLKGVRWTTIARFRAWWPKPEGPIPQP